MLLAVSSELFNNFAPHTLPSIATSVDSQIQMYLVLVFTTFHQVVQEIRQNQLNYLLRLSWKNYFEVHLAAIVFDQVLNLEVESGLIKFVSSLPGTLVGNHPHGNRLKIFTIF